MSWLSDIMGKTQGFLDSYAAATPTATDAIKHDRFDAGIYDELKVETDLLQEMIDDIGYQNDYADDLVRDTLMQFWKSDPEVRGSGEMEPGHLANHAVASDIAGNPETGELRAMTQHDRYGSVMAARSVVGKVKDALQKNKELKEAAQEAAKQQAQQQQQNQAVQQAIQQAQQAGLPIPGGPQPGQGQPGQGQPGQPGQPGGAGGGYFQDPNAQGPMTPDQAAAAQALADALHAASQQQQATGAAQQQAQAAAQQAAAQMKPQVQAGVHQANKDLAEEQELFAAWGVGDGQLQSMDFTERAKLAAALRGNRLNQFRKLLGRFRMMAAAQRVKKIEYGRDQVVGVELSGDLSRVVPSEFAMFAAGGTTNRGGTNQRGTSAARRHLRRDFLVQFVEERLMSRKFEGIEKVGKGAIICLVDCSGSMTTEDKNGLSRESYAKAMALALLDQARAGKRDFVAINFSSRNQVATWRFPKGEGKIEDVMEFTSHFFNGGTNYEYPLDHATDILEAEFNETGKQKGDLIMLTDDECFVASEWQGAWLKRKEKLGFRLFGVAVGMSHAGGTLEALADNCRAIEDFMSPSDSVGDIFRVVT